MTTDDLPMTINISGIDKATLLQALHAKSKALGMSHLHDMGDLTLRQCQDIISQCPVIAGKVVMYFDYLAGRIMKVDISENELDPYLYDRDNGPGAAQRVVDSLTVSDKSVVR